MKIYLPIFTNSPKLPSSLTEYVRTRDLSLPIGELVSVPDSRPEDDQGEGSPQKSPGPQEG